MRGLLLSFLLIVARVVLADFIVFFFFKQKTAYEMRISDWSSDVCSSDLFAPIARAAAMQVTPISAGPPSSPVFTPPQRALMTALSERVMPTTDTPGDRKSTRLNSSH